MCLRLGSKRLLTAIALSVACLSSVYSLPSTNAAEPAQNLLAEDLRTIKGSVMDPNNKPAANVPVRLARFQPDAGPARRKPGDSPTGDTTVGAPAAQPLQKGVGSSGTVATTTTDSNGQFTFKDVKPGPYIISAGTPKAAGALPITVDKERDPAPVTVKLKSATS
ncbi:hypothetical protein BH09PLA1_BH09PLA1_17660 [soil metagenome]